MNVLEAIPVLEDSLSRAGIPHAFGGAIALAYCTGDPRGTVDIDLNIFLPVSRARPVLRALSELIDPEPDEIKALKREEQARFWIGATPLDLFFSYAQFHDVVAKRSRLVELAGIQIPVLECTDLAVFKAMFNRTKDWADIIEALRAESLDLRRLRSWITRLASAQDERHARLNAAIQEAREAQ